MRSGSAGGCAVSAGLFAKSLLTKARPETVANSFELPLSVTPLATTSPGSSPSTKSPLQLGTQGAPTLFVIGRVHGDVATVELRFADGEHMAIKPTSGFVLYALWRPHLAPGHGLVAATGRDARRKILGTESFLPSKR
jgi:hypothetical protein